MFQLPLKAKQKVLLAPRLTDGHFRICHEHFLSDGNDNLS